MQIDIRADGSERVKYRSADFPAYVRLGILSEFPDYAAVCHWHDEVELISVLSGRMEYNVGGNIVSMGAGEGIFVNARQPHFGFSENHSECVFICILLSPLLLCSSSVLENRYVTPVITNEREPFLLLRRETPWQNTILSDVQRIYDCREDDTADLVIQSCFFDIWRELFDHIVTSREPPLLEKHHLATFRSMLRCIEERYREKLTLADISQAGSVSKGTCNTIFMKYTNHTPIGYLTEFRLRKAIELLGSTDLTNAEICYEVGFCSPSYYSETFRKIFGTSPSEYRKTIDMTKGS